jgi:hypothetical protein
MPSIRTAHGARIVRRAFFPVATTILGVTLLAGCHAQRPYERLLTPDRTLNTGHIAEGTTRWRMTLEKDSAMREVGVMTSTTQFADYMGRPAILLVRTVPTPKGNIVDSVMMFHHTLEPVWEHSHQPTKTMLLSFSDSAVTGEWAPADSAMRSVHHRIPRPVFNATGQGLLIASLPLAYGYQTLIPIYSFELGGMELDTLSVVGSGRVMLRNGGERDAWKLAFADPFITATYWVDRETRQILRQEIVSRKNGMTFRQEPVL